MSSDILDKLFAQFSYGLSSRNYCISLQEKIQNVLDRINPDYFTSNHLLLKTKQINDSLNSVADDSLLEKNAQRELLLSNINSAKITHDEALSSINEWIQACNQISENLIKVYNFAAAQLYKQTKSFSKDKHQVTGENNHQVRELNFQVLALESLLGKTELTALPTNLQIEPSDRCNAKCKPCPHCTTNGWAYNDLDTSVLKKLDGILTSAQFVEIFALGEPSIAPSFDEISELVSGYGCQTHIITNGATLNSNKALSKIKKIGISIDGNNPVTFEAIRTGLKFDQVLNAVKIFRQDNPDIFMYFTATINRANIDEIPGIANLAKDYGMNAVCFHRMTTQLGPLSPAVLKEEDIPLYRSKINEAEKILEGTNVLLFDYALLDKLRKEERPLNKKEALDTFDEYHPNQTNTKLSVQDSLICLENKILMPLPSFIKQPGIIQSKTKKPSSRLQILTEAVEQGSCANQVSIEDLTNRLTQLRSEISSKKPEEIKLPYCLSAWFRFILKADGRMFPCSCWSRTYENINNVNSFEDAWNNQFMQDLRKAFTGGGEISQRCSNCVSIDRYQGLTELLYELHLQGISYEQVSKLPNFDPPPGKLKF